MRVTVLAENSPGSRADLKAEFGLSLLIETKEHKILMDTGASGLFADNARALGVDLAEIDWMILSHGHYDHGGGLAKFFQINSQTKAILRRGAQSQFYATAFKRCPSIMGHPAPWTRYIGLDANMLKRFADRLCWIDDDQELSTSVRVLTDIPLQHALAKGNQQLFIRSGGDFLPDNFAHELLLIVEEFGKMVIFSGCAHHGILNMLAAARRNKPSLPIRAVIGGFHLNLPRSEKMAESPAKIRRLASLLGEQVKGSIYTGHCTGSEAFSTMKKELGPRLQALHTGDQFEV